MVMKIPAFARVPNELPNQLGQRGLGLSLAQQLGGRSWDFACATLLLPTACHPLQHLQSWAGEMRHTRVTQPTS